MVIPTKPHATLLASPGLGHLIPMVELANRLTAHHNFHVTIFVVTMEPGPNKPNLLPNQPNTLKPLYDLVVLPYVDSSAHMGPSDKIMTRLVIMMRGYVSSLRSELGSMEQNPTLLVVDLFGTEFLTLADEFNMIKYVYIPSNAWFLAQTVCVPLLDKQVKHEGPLIIPGCKRVEYDDILDPVFDPENKDYDEYVRIALDIGTADGVLVNTWEDLEPTTLFSFKNNKVLKEIFNKPVYPVGPLVRPVRPECLGEELSEWLNKQPKESVLYVSFGSGGTLSSQQTIELALGLEISQQRFIWVVRPPIEHDGAGALFHAMDGQDHMISQYLPPGFMTRTRNLGKVIPMWAPQMEILAHPSVGGFLSHCGWNSTLESLVNGVPIIAWPLYAEQNMNAALMDEEVGVAVRPKVLPTKVIVGREEIKKLINKIMVDDEGIKIRERVKEVQGYAKRALTTEGSTCKSFVQVANNCEMRLNGHTAIASTPSVP
ncbi:anthocyanidin 3-O-glucosyltransferase 5 [Beta vulgaris subsp. vulgaris]|uniref:anthocyanidin 3-O-glucosyltransferase 5 n=1 Tax=Beta vulgaris subsp. vulgaris TaxID=3555 RepID=UPI00053FA707|nr:anthocyanidin 3-O-glucosyltransferase 5 [Beta vulgaris subsp. vulgaris]